MTISKSQYVRGCQCEKSLWVLKKRPELRSEPDEAQIALFDQGHKVGELARGLSPGAREVRFDPSDFQGMILETRRLISSGVDVIYEAAFKEGGVFAVADILVRDGNMWDMYEVKSSTGVRDYHLDDMAVQWFAISRALGLRRAFIVHINNQYERQGALEIEKLFHREDVTEIASGRQEEVAVNLARFQGILQAEHMPTVDIGPHCLAPYDCDFQAYCWKDVPDQSIFNLYRMSWPRRFDLYHEGIVTYEDIYSSGIELTRAQRIQVETALRGAPRVDRGVLKGFLRGISYPVNFLDFETFVEAIPRFDRERPYMKIPVQYSLHILREDGSLEHRQFLAGEHEDPRGPLIERLLKDITPEGSIVAYNASFEKGVIAGLCDFWPERRGALQGLMERFVDLIDPFRGLGYYHPDFNGSFSIKSVLPAIFPHDAVLDYSVLDVQDGSMAMNVFPALRHVKDQGERKRLRAALLAYCRLDTLAMVRIFQRLVDIAGG